MLIDELKSKLNDVEDKLLRSLADNDNLRKRHEKEIEDNSKDLMLDSVVEFLEFSEKSCSNEELYKKINIKDSANSNVYNKYRSRISPIWYEYNS